MTRPIKVTAAYWASLEKYRHVQDWPAWRRAGINVTQPGIPQEKPRFFVDHGMLHDRVTGKHVTTNADGPYEDGITACCALMNKLADEAADSIALLARGVELFDGPTVDDVVTAICVMIRKAAEAHRDPSDPYPTSGTYAAAAFAEELADDIANGEWRKHLRTPHPLPQEKK